MADLFKRRCPRGHIHKQSESCAQCAEQDRATLHAQHPAMRTWDAPELELPRSAAAHVDALAMPEQIAHAIFETVRVPISRSNDPLRAVHEFCGVKPDERLPQAFAIGDAVECTASSYRDRVGTVIGYSMNEGAPRPYIVQFADTQWEGFFAENELKCAYHDCTPFALADENWQPCGKCKACLVPTREQVAARMFPAVERFAEDNGMHAKLDGGDITFTATSVTRETMESAHRGRHVPVDGCQCKACEVTRRFAPETQRTHCTFSGRPYDWKVTCACTPVVGAADQHGRLRHSDCPVHGSFPARSRPLNGWPLWRPISGEWELGDGDVLLVTTAPFEITGRHEWFKIADGQHAILAHADGVTVRVPQ
jgi:hypothetical protein